MKKMSDVTVIGAGLAGCEASWQLAQHGLKVKLIEMKPKVKTSCHQYDGFAELVCSNSLKSNDIKTASGLLKQELRFFNSLIIEAADKTSVGAGSALAVNRQMFSDYVTNKIVNNKNIDIECSEVNHICEDELTIVSTGPLTYGPLIDDIIKYTGDEYLHFYDAVAPIISFDSIDTNIAFYASRYQKGSPDYLNCPMNKKEYDTFYDGLINAECAELRDSEEKIEVFEGCMPIERMAIRGKDTLRYGPMKPVGIVNPQNGEKYYAVVQLRKEDLTGTMYNIVGFQTHLKFHEQERVFRLIPGLNNCEFLRYGVMHRNTFLNSPKLLNPDYSLRSNGNIYFAGQISGVEGYVESTCSGLVAAMSIYSKLRNYDFDCFSKNTMIGALSDYISSSTTGNFQPMNANFGILPKDGEISHCNKKDRYKLYSDRSKADSLILAKRLNLC